MKKIAIVTAVAAGLAFSAPPAAAQGVCVVGVFIAAFYANAKENRELTAKEAATCGLMYGADVPKAAPAKAKQPQKAAARTKTQ
jgi:hypothetical protein